MKLLFISGPPYAPRDLKVTRVVTRNAVLLSWLLPSMDDHYVSNGSKVIGYSVSLSIAFFFALIERILTLTGH